MKRKIIDFLVGLFVIIGMGSLWLILMAAASNHGNNLYLLGN